MARNHGLVPRKKSTKPNDSREINDLGKNINYKKKSKKQDSKSKTEKHRKSSSSKRSGSKSKSKSRSKLRSKSRSKSHRRHSDDDIINGSDIDIADDNDPEDYSQNMDSEYTNDSEEETKVIRLEDKTKERLKGKIIEWLDFDDKIKILNARTKKYKDAKKQQEELILKMISKLGVNDTKMDVHNDNDEFRGRVYRHKSSTKGALKEDIIKNALMEVFRDEKKVDQLFKKIDSKRPINERYYLKRTKGSKDD